MDFVIYFLLTSMAACVYMMWRNTRVCDFRNFVLYRSDWNPKDKTFTQLEMLPEYHIQLLHFWRPLESWLPADEWAKVKERPENFHDTV